VTLRENCTEIAKVSVTFFVVKWGEKFFPLHAARGRNFSASKTFRLVGMEVWRTG